VRRLTPLSLVAAALLLSCASGRGCCSLPPVEGRVLDRDTRAPIAGALVVEQWRGGLAPSDEPPVLHARFATSDPAGRFALEAARAPGLRFAFGGGRPRYAFVHPRYGFVRAGEPAAAGGLVLEGSRADVASQRALAALCETAPRNDAERELASRACAGR
jgi:hypothetical protein